MRDEPTAPARIVRGLLVAAMLVAAWPAAAAPVVQPPFDQDYFILSLGKIAGVHEPYGAVNFGLGTANQIVVGGFAGGSGLISIADLARDATGSIAGFLGTASALADAYGIGAGVAYGPDDVLFYSRVDWKMGEVKYESTTTDKLVPLLSQWEPRPSGLNFVPPGFPGAGQLKITTFNANGDWWSIDIEPDDMGTYDITGATKGPALPGYPEGFTYVPAGLPGFPNPSVVVCEYANAYGIGKLTAYDVDQNGNPVLATRREIVTGLDVPYGIATDPLTGDLLWTSYLGFAYLLRKAPIPPTTTTSTTTTSSTTTSLPNTTTTTSSTTTTHAPTTTSIPTTTTTTATPTTTSFPAPASTTSTTSAPTTSSTAAPTTSTSVPSTTTSSTTTTSAPTTTTIPPACTSEPSFPSLACRIEALRELVRASNGLGRLEPAFVARLDRARQTVDDGAAQCAAGRRTSAREMLDRLARQMLAMRARLRRHGARTIVAPDLAATIADAARSIGADARTLRGALECP